MQQQSSHQLPQQQRQSVDVDGSGDAPDVFTEQQRRLQSKQQQRNQHSQEQHQPSQQHQHSPVQQQQPQRDSLERQIVILKSQIRELRNEKTGEERSERLKRELEEQEVILNGYQR